MFYRLCAWNLQRKRFLSCEYYYIEKWHQQYLIAQCNGWVTGMNLLIFPSIVDVLTLIGNAPHILVNSDSFNVKGLWSIS